ncbi:MAG: hypothetical protein IJ795_00375 [Bacteroidales bacterium]|nr:hypothetical protein [Bacteroidales bacterium]
MKRYALILIAALLGLVSCRDKVNEEFLLSESLCLEDNGKVIFSYDPASCQVSCNPQKHLFRVMTDNTSSWYSVECETMPTTAGQSVTASVKWSVPGSVQNLSSMDMRVEKIEGGKIWLWSPRRKIAVSVMKLP